VTSAALGRGLRVLSPDLAYVVKTYFDRLPVQHTVAAVNPLPYGDGAQFGRGDRGLDGQAVEVLEVVVGYEPGVAAGGGVRGGADLEVLGGPGHHALLAVKGLLGPHVDEGDRLQVLIVACGLAHRPWPRGKQRCLMADSGLALLWQTGFLS
jgi:hypothetical protein